MSSLTTWKIRFYETICDGEDVEFAAVVDELIARTQQLVDTMRGDEAGWPGVTTNDVITTAFQDLRRRGVAALECAGLTIQDGW